MRSRMSRNIARAFSLALLLSAAAACERDGNPYGAAWRDAQSNLVGAYRPLTSLSFVRNLPDDFRPLPPGGDLRLVFGSSGSLTGWVVIPSATPGETGLNARLNGSWDYDRSTRHVALSVAATASTEAFELTLQATSFDGWVRLQGTGEINGQLIHVDLGKPTPRNPETTGGGGGPLSL